jgi:pimeloyl-ACP methyl ester carboxylesterase/uncharacterized membrane protein
MSKTQSVWFAVTESTFLGLLVTLFLVLGVFAGATEAVITGSIMLGFGTGWLALALLTSRYTDQPQRWAYVPAAYFGIVGLLLIIFSPGNAFLSTTGWVWPVVLLVMTLWSFIQARSQLRSRSRGLVVYPVLVVLLLVSIGGIYEKIQERITSQRFAMAGQLLDVGGYKLHIECTGNGSPTVVLEGGLGEPSSIMSAWIAPTVAKQTRVCVYDREGRGWSEASPHPLDGNQTASALHTLLSKAGVTGPVVVAGHSAGGIYALNYAKLYPDQVKGIALLDSMSPYQYEKLPGWSAFYAGFRRVSAIAPSLTRVGVGRLMYSSAYTDLPSPQREQERTFWATPELWRSQRDEFAVLRTALLQAQDVKSLDTKPLYVVSGQKGEQAGWGTLQEQMAALSSNSVHVTIQNATHADIPENKDIAAKSAQGVLKVVDAIRTGKYLEKE